MPNFKLKEFSAVMCDLETVSIKPNAAIAAIGLVQFDLMTGQTGMELELVIDLEDAMKYGIADGDTVSWWMGQSEEARAIFKSKHKNMLMEALGKVIAFFDIIPLDKRDIYFFGNGADFDPVILQNAFEKTDLPLPWSPFNTEHVRTYVNIGRFLLNIDPKNSFKREGIYHSAVDDCKHQIKYVCAIFQAISSLVSEINDARLTIRNLVEQIKLVDLANNTGRLKGFNDLMGLAHQAEVLALPKPEKGDE